MPPKISLYYNIGILICIFHNMLSLLRLKAAKNKSKSPASSASLSRPFFSSSSRSLSPQWSGAWATGTISIPVLKMEGILDYIKENAINEVFIFLRHGESGKLMSKFMIMGLTVHVGLDLELRNLSNVTIDQLANYTIVTSTISRATVGELFVKRAFDIFVGIIGLIVTAITFIFVAPIIKIQSPGPVFFVQKRVGKNGRVFNMIKFRSMHVDADYHKAALCSRSTMTRDASRLVSSCVWLR